MKIFADAARLARCGWFFDLDPTTSAHFHLHLILHANIHRSQSNMEIDKFTICSSSPPRQSHKMNEWLQSLQRHSRYHWAHTSLLLMITLRASSKERGLKFYPKGASKIKVKGCFCRHVDQKAPRFPKTP